ncbi:Protein of unknown function [Glycomyces sambucus]|uniref:DUF998 domain-containing protein n=1 Tax=Glycomyces sambucus TaxID=380244 RepID=A0A1G9K8P3_9ACTN|nr:DUF998 domain-containing protein [Glycomyces sambucus]SDL46009.1 Protein of unknown function [Glycomyces sambucus]
MSTSLETSPTGTHAARTTRALLAALAVSAPLWIVVSLAQAFTQPGFDLARHPISMLSVGPLGWLQITNFIVAGSLAVAGAIGLRRAVPSRWAPRLIAVYGVGYVLSGVFVMEPGAGFPEGTPMETSGTLAWHTVVHLLVGMVAFIALTAALFVLARAFAWRGEKSWAWAARIGAIAVIAGNALSSAQLFAPSLDLAIGVMTGMVVLSLIAAKLRREA